jgi:phosphoribosylformylglycinamidine cyclo-ligase
MYCNNGTPIALLDYYGCDKLDKQQFNQFIAGALEICKEYSIPMIGGETAEMRGIFTDGEVEVLGILLGVVNETPENGIGIQKGNYIYGIESSGAHTNGFTKLREIATLVNGGMPEWVKSFFSQPHKCYVKIMDCIKAILADSGINIVGKSHITGGGFVDNIERILPGVIVDGVDGMCIELGRWDLNKEWQWVYDNAGMEWDAFIRVFNAGWGFCFITDKEISIDVIDTFKIKEKIKLIGNII